MKVRIVLILAAALTLAAGASTDVVRKTDRDRLQGTWQIVSVEIEGQKLSMEALKGSRLAIKGSDYVFTLDKTKWDLTFRLDESKKPKAIDLKVVEGPEKGKTFKGIYVLDGDQYKICRSTEPGRDRPTEFATKAKSGLMMVVWKRVKP